MGCGGSKAEDLPLVVRCRERRDLIRAAASHRYALAAAHISYFRSLRDVGDALRRFVDEELVTAASSSNSSFSSPSLPLPRDSKQKHGNADESSRHLRDFDDEDEDDDESHLHISDSSSDADFDDDYLHHYHHPPPNNHYPPQHKHQQLQHESEENAHLHHNHKHQAHKGKKKGSDGESSHFHSEEESSPHYPRAGFHGYGNNQDREPETSFHYPGGANFRGYGSGFGDGYGNDPFSDLPHSHSFHYPPQASTSYGAPYMDQWDQTAAPPPWYYSNNTNVFYMRKGAPAAQTVVHEPPPEPAQGYSDLYWNPAYGNLGYGANYGYAAVGMRKNEAGRESRQKETPPPPSPKASGWDFFNPFNGLENGYEDLYSGKRYGYRSSSSSPDSAEVREREGIPDLEEETESEVYNNKEVLKGNNKMKDKGKGKSVENSSRSMPHQGSESSIGKEPFRPKPVPLHKSKGSSRSVPSSSSLESENDKKSVPLQQKKGSAKLSMPSEFSDKSGKKPSVPLPQYKTGSEKKSIPPQYSEKSVKVKPSISLPEDEGSSSIEMEGSISSLSDENRSSSPENVVLERVDEGFVWRKGVIFEVEEVSKQDGDSSKLSSVTLLSPRGNRDLREVVAEIRDEFEMAAAYGKEVAVMLEVGKVPYQPSFLKVTRSRMLYSLLPSLSSRDPPSLESARLASKTMKLAKSYFDDVGKNDVGKNVDTKACNLSSTLDKLYAWEKKLYKEVKDEEKLRVVYEKQCKRLKILDEEGAEPIKIDATRASIRRLLTKLDVSVKAIDAISIRIHKLRDEELQPQVAELIHGFIRMWKSMLKCHQKQFQAVMDSKMRRLRANTASHSGHDPASRASARLERELRAWCSRFNDWINSQKSCVESLNSWLLHCLHYKPEETPDGPIPYSPGRLGAPPIFVICNDWAQAMRAVSEARVADAMNTFAASLRQLWEKQDEEDRQRVKAEYLLKDYKKRVEEEKKGLPMVVQSDSSNSGGGVSRLDDLKVDLDSMKERVAEERVKHKDAMKLVNDAASRSLQGGLVPIFKALESFTKEALNAHEHVRFERPSGPGS